MKKWPKHDLNIGNVKFKIFEFREKTGKYFIYMNGDHA